MLVWSSFRQESIVSVYIELRTINVCHCSPWWISCAMERGRIRGDRPEGACHTRFLRKLIKGFTVFWLIHPSSTLSVSMATRYLFKMVFQTVEGSFSSIQNPLYIPEAPHLWKFCMHRQPLPSPCLCYWSQCLYHLSMTRHDQLFKHFLSEL